VETQFVPLLKRLATGDWFTSRCQCHKHFTSVTYDRNNISILKTPRGASGVTMLDIPKLSNIGHGYYLYMRPCKDFRFCRYPPPPAFVPGKPFQPDLISDGKARSLPKTVGVYPRVEELNGASLG
jgi:hypothetical protein